MTTPARQRHPSQAGGRQSLREDGRAVSPVVGMILVLAISVVGIAAVLYWGIPAIDEMKANVEYRSVQSQFNEFDAIVKELVSGTTEKTAKRWQPTFNRGSLVVQNNTEGWLFATEPYVAGGDADFLYANLSDGDHLFSIVSKNASVNILVEAYLVQATTRLDELTVNHVGGANAAPAAMASIGTWSAGTTYSFGVYNETGVAVNLRDATFKFRIYSGTTLVAEAWYMTTGRVDYELHGGIGQKHVVANNGAILTGQEGSYTMYAPPAIPPQSNNTGVHRFFGRAIVMTGNASFGGDDRFELLVSLTTTATLASYDCADDDAYTDCVRTSKIFNYGSYDSEWYSYLDDHGYDFDVKTGHYDLTYLEDREGYMAYTLLQSRLQLRG